MCFQCLGLVIYQGFQDFPFLTCCGIDQKTKTIPQVFCSTLLRRPVGNISILFCHSYGAICEHIWCSVKLWKWCICWMTVAPWTFVLYLVTTESFVLSFQIDAKSSLSSWMHRRNFDLLSLTFGVKFNCFANDNFIKAAMFVHSIRFSLFPWSTVLSITHKISINPITPNSPHLSFSPDIYEQNFPDSFNHFIQSSCLSLV